MKKAWVEVHLDRLAANVRAVLAALDRRTELIFVVKANAYGHGLEAVARRAAAEGVRWFAVAHTDEARAVRRVAPDARVLLFGASDPADAPLLHRERIIAVIYSETQAAAWSRAAAAAGVDLPVHIKLDTGMGRFGLLWSEAEAAFARILALPGLRPEGVCTHFASVEARRASLGPEQMERFAALADRLSEQAGARLFRHASSSRAMELHAEWDLDGVRPGIVLYGYGGRAEGLRVGTAPVLEWKAPVMQVKNVPADFPVGYYSTHVTAAATRVATIGVGYCDGYHRALSNRGFVLIRGRRCPVIGRVSMNWITADLGADGPGEEGDEAVLIGGQGEASVWADELAGLAGTIAYELLTGISPLAPRQYAG